MCSVKKVLLVLVFIFICRRSCAESNVNTCDFICGCESDLAVKFNKIIKPQVTGGRRGLFDPFPKDRAANTSYSKSKLRMSEQPPVEIVFIFVNIGISATFQHLINKNNIRLPYQAFVLILSLIAGIISKLHPTFDNYTLIATINPMLIMLMFLPSIIIHTLYSVDIYVMQKCVGQILLFGFAGFWIRSLVIGAIMVLFIDQHWYTDQSFFIFGAMCAITQPQEALRVLKTVGEFKHITALLEAESLISLSLGIFVYNVAIFTSMDYDGSSLLYTFNASISSIVLGTFVGWITLFLLKFVSAEVTVFTYVVVSGAYLLYYITQVIICFSGVLSLMAYLCVLHRMKSALSPNDEKFFQHVTSCFAFVSNTMIFSMAGIVVTESLLLDFKLYTNMEFIGAFFTYFVTYLIRSGVLFSLLPLMRIIGYDISWQNTVIMAISGIRGSFALCLALASSQDVEVETFTSRYLLCVSVLVLLSIIINPLLLSWTIRRFKLDQVPEARINNMTAILKDIIKGRSRALAFLKNDRGYSEANWGVVEAFTILKHPYPWAMDDEMNDRWEHKKSSSTCPQCKTEQRHYGTDADLTTEANLRILQMKRINFRRQYHTNLLSIQELRLLEAVIDHASDTRSKVLVLHSIKDLWAENWFWGKFRQTLCSIMFIDKDEYVQPPLNRCRLKVYKIVESPLYTVIIFFVNLLSVGPILYDYNYMKYEKNERDIIKLEVTLCCLYFLFCVLFLCDFILKILAMGFRQYFKFKWFWLEFLLLIFSIIDSGIELVSISYLLLGQPFKSFEAHIWMKSVRALYLLRIIRLIQLNLSKIIVCVDNYIQFDKVSGYNVAQCVVRTLDDIIKYTQYMSENERPSFELEYRETAQRFEILKDLGVIQRDYPLVPITVKTKHAIQEILNTMQGHVDALRDKGIIDDMEIKKLTKIFEEKNEELRAIIMVPSPLPGAVVKGISWLDGDIITYEYLLNNAELLSFTRGDKIISAGDKPQGLYVFMSGSATSNYVYSNVVEYNQKVYGLLPNCDFLMSLNFDEYQQHKDIILPGFVFGEIGFLTDRPYNYNITCDTSVTVLHIAKEHMHKACKLSEDLEYRIWKTIAIKLASLKVKLQFKKFIADTLKFKLQSGYFFILTDCVSLELYDIPEYFFLLEGALEDKANDTKYIAPTSIPDTAQLLFSFDASRNEELLKGLYLPESFDMDSKKVDIKVLMVVPGEESIKYSMKSDSEGNYWVTEDQIDLFCELHKTRESRRKESLIFGTFILTEFEEPDDPGRRQSRIERLFHSISSRSRKSSKGSNTDN